MDVIVTVKSKSGKKITELEQHGKVVHVTMLRNLVLMQCSAEQLEELKQLDNVIEAREARLGSLPCN